MSVARFKDSVGWQRAMRLIAEVYQATAEFPKQEMFGLTNQLRRASVSVASNIAEGQGRLTTGEFVHFLGMARGSSLEVLTQLETAKMLKFGGNAKLEKAESTALEVVPHSECGDRHESSEDCGKVEELKTEMKLYSLLLTHYSLH